MSFLQLFLFRSMDNKCVAHSYELIIIIIISNNNNNLIIELYFGSANHVSSVQFSVHAFFISVHLPYHTISF